MKALLPRTDFDGIVLDMDTMILHVLHEEFHFGAERCYRFYSAWFERVRNLRKKYDDVAYERVREDLKKYGIEVEKWNKELMG